MKKIKLALFILFLFSLKAQSQKIDHLISFREMQSTSYFRFNYENDFFTATDKNYTQGYNLEYVNPGLKRNPLNLQFIKLDNGKIKYGIAIEHLGFTPTDFVSEEIQIGDRPFAAAILLKNFNSATDSINLTKISQTFSFGLIGQGAFGKEMQVEIHRATGNKIPGGWHNQIKNDLILNFRLDYEKQLYSFNNNFALNAQASMQVGTLFTNTSLSINTIIGFFDSPFSSNTHNNNFQVYLYSQPILSVIGYDATLQGGLLNKESPYTIKASEVKRLTAQFNYGLIIKTRSLYLEYARTTLTREFESGNNAKWGGIKLGYVF
jgi:hypothetical protein